MYLRPTTSTTELTHVARSAIVVESTQTTENIIGYVILAIAVGLILLGFIGAFLVRRCCAYLREMRVCWRRQKTRRRIASSPSSSTALPKEKAQISTTTAILRSDHSEKVPDMAPSSSETNKVFSDPPPYNCRSSPGINHDDSNDNNIDTICLLRSPSPVHVNVFNDPCRNSPFGMLVAEGSVNDLNWLKAGSGSFLSPPVTTSIRPHGIPLTPLPEDASAVFPMPYSEADEQTLYGSIDSESEHDYPHLVLHCQQ